MSSAKEEYPHRGRSTPRDLCILVRALSPYDWFRETEASDRNPIRIARWQARQLPDLSSTDVMTMLSVSDRHVAADNGSEERAYWLVPNRLDYPFSNRRMTS